MTDQLPNEYWESPGQNGPFLWSLFMGQQEQVQQLRESNAFLQSRVTDMHDDITNVASTTASTVAQAIVVNPQASIPVQSSHNPVQSAKATDPKPFDGNHDKTEEFVRAVWIVVTAGGHLRRQKDEGPICTLLHARGHGTGLGSERDHGSHKWDVPNADIRHLLGECRENLWRPRQSTHSSRTTSRPQNDTRYHGRRLYSSI